MSIARLVGFSIVYSSTTSSRLDDSPATAPSTKGLGIAGMYRQRHCAVLRVVKVNFWISRSIMYPDRGKASSPRNTFTNLRYVTTDSYVRV
jgi:hypothetical protein